MSKALAEILKCKQFKANRVIEEDDLIRVDGNFCDPVNQKTYYCIFTISLGWEHASVSQRNKTPSWDIMCRVKDIFWNKDECCVEYHPKEEDYINNHEHCLHIWKPVDIEIPTPPSIMVGIKGLNSNEAQILSRGIINSLSLEQKVELSRLNLNRKMRRKR